MLRLTPVSGCYFSRSSCWFGARLRRRSLKILAWKLRNWSSLFSASTAPFRVGGFLTADIVQHWNCSLLHSNISCYNAPSRVVACILNLLATNAVPGEVPRTSESLLYREFGAVQPVKSSYHTLSYQICLLEVYAKWFKDAVMTKNAPVSPEWYPAPVNGQCKEFFSLWLVIVPNLVVLCWTLWKCIAHRQVHRQTNAFCH